MFLKGLYIRAIKSWYCVVKVKVFRTLTLIAVEDTSSRVLITAKDIISHVYVSVKDNDPCFCQGHRSYVLLLLSKTPSPPLTLSPFPMLFSPLLKREIVICLLQILSISSNPKFCHLVKSEQRT